MDGSRHVSKPLQILEYGKSINTRTHARKHASTHTNKERKNKEKRGERCASVCVSDGLLDVDAARTDKLRAELVHVICGHEQKTSFLRCAHMKKRKRKKRAKSVSN